MDYNDTNDNGITSFQQATSQPTTTNADDNASWGLDPINAPETSLDEGTLSDADMAEALKSMSNKEVIDLFVNGLIIDKGLNSQDDASKEEIRKELTEKVEDFLTQSLLNSLPDEAIDNLDEKIDSGAVTQEDITQAIKNSGIDSGQIIVDALVKFRQQYLNSSDNETKE